MTIAGKAVLVTGANRGIGQALAAEALRRGAKRAYAGTRQPLAHPDGRVTPLTLDVTSAAQAIFDGVEAGEEDIFPDPMSQAMAEGWRGGAAKALERQNAALAQAAPVPS
jgi:NAD(P)-dependent dehydrogenase (short-subunit alcohol dehydrogenase family)